MRWFLTLTKRLDTLSVTIKECENSDFLPAGVVLVPCVFLNYVFRRVVNWNISSTMELKRENYFDVLVIWEVLKAVFSVQMFTRVGQVYLSMQVRWLEQQSVRRRVKRTASRSDYWKWSWNDPLWPKMWYLVSTRVVTSLTYVSSFKQATFCLTCTLTQRFCPQRAFYPRMPCTERTTLSQDFCPSVCLSVTRRYSVETVQHIIKLFLKL